MMNLRSARVVGLATASAVLLGLGATAPAHATPNPKPPTGNHEEGKQYGTVVRSVFSEHANGSGSTIVTYGSSPCTLKTDNKPDNKISIAWKNWDNNISKAADFNKCDTFIFEHVNWTGASKGYTNYAEGGGYVGAVLNDEISSYMLS